VLFKKREHQLTACKGPISSDNLYGQNHSIKKAELYRRLTGSRAEDWEVLLKKREH
jgi:hypothetical protein